RGGGVPHLGEGIEELSQLARNPAPDGLLSVELRDLGLELRRGQDPVQRLADLALSPDRLLREGGRREQEQEERRGEAEGSHPARPPPEERATDPRAPERPPRAPSCGPRGRTPRFGCARRSRAGSSRC